MTTVVNPVSMTIDDATVTSDIVTNFILKAGVATGGPYTAGQVQVAVATLTVNAGVITGPFPGAAAWTPALAHGVTYFAVAEAVNAAGVSGNSPEASFSFLAAPAAPSGFVLA